MEFGRMIKMDIILNFMVTGQNQFSLDSTQLKKH